ncbi:MAG: hypothetical protein WAS21_14100 [Geminicoccaceae bacterium]
MPDSTWQDHAGAHDIGRAFAAEVQARDQISVVGTSTVFPFSTAVAEQFGQKWIAVGCPR